MRRLRIVVAVASCSALVALSGGAGLAHSSSATSGKWTITTDTTLTEDHYGRIIVGADNITLDCAGHQIIGTRYDPTTHQGDFAGVALSGRSGVTVKNCHLSGGFWAGFYVPNSNGNTLSDNVAGQRTGRVRPIRIQQQQPQRQHRERKQRLGRIRYRRRIERQHADRQHGH